ncbi:hypothetical protein POM88_042092 [Heracleum sosnowskyi]|uniref:Uncharacterized protein n=1 Tax=Heracleum sosnowskyi TaxID=360622 RepID=A0AAD8HG70_9APIA|nr:hypothetical protein POM88_042092 [Heracleum sosnowskyi]
MTFLTNLNLSNNLLQGNIPESFGRNLSHLQWLDLFGNNFDGELQEFLKGLFKGAGATGSLDTLRLGNNKLFGSLPDITKFSSLKTFSLLGNQLNGFNLRIIILNLISPMLQFLTKFLTGFGISPQD